MNECLSLSLLEGEAQIQSREKKKRDSSPTKFFRDRQASPLARFPLAYSEHKKQAEIKAWVASRILRALIKIQIPLQTFRVIVKKFRVLGCIFELGFLRKMAASEINKEAFVELQGRLVDTTAKIKQVQVQIRNKDADKKRALLTLEELNYLDDDTTTYKAVGKAFIHEPKSKLVKEQQDKAEECEGAITNLVASKEYLERQMREIESNFRELLQQAPALAQQVMAMSVA